MQKTHPRGGGGQDPFEGVVFFLVRSMEGASYGFVGRGVVLTKYAIDTKPAQRNSGASTLLAKVNGNCIEKVGVISDNSFYTI